MSPLVDRGFEDPEQAAEITDQLRRWSACSTLFDGTSGALCSGRHGVVFARVGTRRRRARALEGLGP
jgi:hypothetical protein